MIFMKFKIWKAEEVTVETEEGLEGDVEGVVCEEATVNVVEMKLVKVTTTGAVGHQKRMNNWLLPTLYAVQCHIYNIV